MRCCHLHPLLPQPWVSFLARLLSPQCPSSHLLVRCRPLCPWQTCFRYNCDTAHKCGRSTHTGGSAARQCRPGHGPVLSAAPAVSQGGGQDQIRPVRHHERPPSRQYVAVHTVGGTPGASWSVFQLRKAAAAGNSVSSDMGVLLPSLCCSAHPGQQDPQPPHLWAAGGEGGPAAWWPRMEGIRQDLPAACCTGPIGAVERAQP